MTESKFNTFSDMFKEMAAKYQDLPISSILSAYSRVGTFDSYTSNPYIPNRRVKQISGYSAPYSKSEITEMLKSPENSEIPLRETSRSLEYTAQPYFNIRKTYQDVLTYRYYCYPAFVEKEDAGKPELEREGRLIDKICRELRVQQLAHKVIGQAVQQGKVFYTYRASVDKSHNKVNYAFAQQLPQDWCKIVGFNNISGWTVAFNMMYFIQPGAAWWEFGNLFEPYINNLYAVVRSKQTAIYAEKGVSIDLRKVEELRAAGMLNGTPEIYNENGAWFYWVNLPADKAWGFEIDDTNATVVSPLTGLILTMSQIAQYENLQLELYSNPLVAVLTGEIPYMDNADPTANDPYKLSPTGRAYFETLWYQMLSANNTGGVGFFAAPVENIKLQQLAESPSATDISAKGYSDAIQKSGIGIIPATDEPRVGLVNISAKLAAQYGKCVYKSVENMMNSLFAALGFKWEWRFVMFGDIFSEKEEIAQAVAGIKEGILPDIYKYDALMGRTVYDDISMSRTIAGMKINELRQPLDASHAIIPDKESKAPTPQGGRPPTAQEDIQSEGQEAQSDKTGD